MLPSITITDATPQKTATPAKVADLPYRLLYRGALSLPDSYLLLDGIAFSARLPNRGVSTPQNSPSGSLARDLMYNPLALALESMRGRQTLRFKGTVHLEDMWMEDSGEVYMDIHPCATLTRVYFENVLCLSPLVGSLQGPRQTQVGVRVSLGDTDGPETTEIVIYGETNTLLCPPPLQLVSTAPSTSIAPPLCIRVARITPAPRAPRPDDPTPRQPPTHIFGCTTLGDLGANKRIIPRSNTGKIKEVEDPVVRRARDVMLHLPRSNGKGRDDQRQNGDFKVPELPVKVRRKQGTGTDVFGAVEPPKSVSGTNGQGKGKATAVDGDVNPIEGANKLVLKKMAVQCLSNAGIPRSHAEFKDIFGFVYRGATFALVKTVHVSPRAAETLVEAHVKMYVDSQRSVDVDDTGG